MFTEAITIRILTSADAPQVRSAFARLSADSRYHRYGMPVVRPGRLLDWVGHLGGDEHFALGAWRKGRDELVGVARYVRLGTGAEVAVTVVDELQGVGIGTLLLEALLREACQHGLPFLTASVMLDNKPAVRLARRFGARSTGHGSGGRLEFEIPTLGCPPPVLGLPTAA